MFRNKFDVLSITRLQMPIEHFKVLAVRSVDM